MRSCTLYHEHRPYMYLSHHMHLENILLCSTSQLQSKSNYRYCTVCTDDTTAAAVTASQLVGRERSTMINRAMRHWFTTSPANKVTAGGGKWEPPDVTSIFHLTLKNISFPGFPQQATVSKASRNSLSLSLNEVHGISFCLLSIMILYHHRWQ